MASRKPLVIAASNRAAEMPAGDTLDLSVVQKGSLIQGSNVTLSGTLTDRLLGTGDVTISASGGGGGGNIPIDSKTSSYTFVAGDIGRNICKTSTSGITFTLNNSVFSAGDIFMVSNFATSGNLTISRGSGVTLYYAGSTSNANRTIFPRGIAIIYMESASVGYIYGNGIS